MCSIAIIDDEVTVCELIKGLINWESLKMEFAGQAYNGIDAIKMIKEKRPDIVITDIQMPGLNGIDLIGEIRQQKYDTSFIIISGYSDFKFAQGALRYGVEDYLIKPIKQKELNNLLLKIKTIKNNNIRQNQEVIEMHDKLVQSMKMNRKAFILNAINNAEQGSNTILTTKETINNFFKFENGKYCSFVLKIDQTVNSKNDDESISIILEKISEMLSNKMADKCYDFEILKEGSRLFGIFNYSTDLHEPLKEKKKKISEVLKIALTKFDSYHLTIAIGNEVEKIDRISESLKNAMDLIKCRVVYDIDRILDANEKEFTPHITQNIISIDDENEIYRYVDIFNAQELINWLNNKFLKYEGKKDFLQLLDFILQFVDILFTRTSKNGLTDESKKRLFPDVVKEQIDNCLSIEDIKNIIKKYTSELIETCYKFKRLQDSMPIRIAKEFIYENYNKNISLNDIAKIVFLNPAYLCVIFKKEVGMNISDFIINVRIEEAKKLFKTTSYNISEIAEKVGYKDTRYFSKLFYKSIGIKPTEYRRYHS